MLLHCAVLSLHPSPVITRVHYHCLVTIGLTASAPTPSTSGGGAPGLSGWITPAVANPAIMPSLHGGSMPGAAIRSAPDHSGSGGISAAGSGGYNATGAPSVGAPVGLFAFAGPSLLSSAPPPLLGNIGVAPAAGNGVAMPAFGQVGISFSAPIAPSAVAAAAASALAVTPAVFSMGASDGGAPATTAPSAAQVTMGRANTVLPFSLRLLWLTAYARFARF